MPTYFCSVKHPQNTDGIHPHVPDSGSPTYKLTELKKHVDQTVVQRVEELLEKAKSGEIIGFVALLSVQGEGYSSGFAGEFNAGSIIMAFEIWKHEWIKGKAEE